MKLSCVELGEVLSYKFVFKHFLPARFEFILFHALCSQSGKERFGCSAGGKESGP